jgi:hypothetical protein
MTTTTVILIVAGYIAFVLFVAKFCAIGNVGENPFNEPEN